MPASATAPPNPNAILSMSPEAKARMRQTEKAEYRYYNDMGKNRGHCTWGVGILAHKGVCTKEELGKTVSAAEVDAAYDRKVAEAEQAVRRNIRVPLTQEQFDGLVSLTYNTGSYGASDTYDYVNRGDNAGAASNMRKMIKVTLKLPGGKKKVVVAPGLVKRREEESAGFRPKSAPTSKTVTASK